MRRSWRRKSKKNGKAVAKKNGHSDLKFLGWRRENGRVGVRNHVIILPLDDLSNAACEAVANNIKGTMALPHAYGRLQFGEDLDLHFRTLIGTGANPNVAAVVVIGIEDGWTKRVVDGIAKTGKPVTGFGIEGHGDIATIAKASYVAKQYVQMGVGAAARGMRHRRALGLDQVRRERHHHRPRLLPDRRQHVRQADPARHLRRVRRDLRDHRRRASRQARARSTRRSATSGMKVWKAYQDDVIEAHKTDDLSDSQPTKGNIAGGLTTIEEKALGNLEKIGRECQYIDVLEPAEAPRKGPGLYYMDTSSAAAECVTLMAAAGYAVHTFPTGQGNVIGNPIVPVIKITGNPKTIRTMGEHIDVDVSGILRRDMTIPQAGDALIDMIVRTANGRLTAAEALGHREYVMTKLYRSA